MHYEKEEEKDYNGDKLTLTDGMAEITYNNEKETLFGKKFTFMTDGSEYYATLKVKTAVKDKE